MSDLTYLGFGAGPWTHNDGTVSYATPYVPPPAGGPTTYLGFGAGPWRYLENYAVPPSSLIVQISMTAALNATVTPFDSVSFRLGLQAGFDAAIQPPYIEGEPLPAPIFAGTIPDQAFIRNAEVEGNFASYFTNASSGSYSLIGWPTGIAIDSAGELSGSPTVGGLYSSAFVRFTSLAGEIATSNQFQVVVSSEPMRQGRPWVCPPVLTKDVNETKSIECPWGDLDEDEIITSEWDSSDLTPSYSYFIGTVAVAVFAGGTAGKCYNLVNRITTGRGETRERYAKLIVTQQLPSLSGNDYGG